MARAGFTPRERRLIARLSRPSLVQRFLRTFPYNHEEAGETLRSFRGTLQAGRAHCLEAALVAASILGEHGHPPLLLDLESKDCLDHVLFVFRWRGAWGAVASSRDPGLYGRRPMFRDLVGLVRSYVLPYIDRTGRITGWGLFDLRNLSARVDWRFSDKNVWAVEQALIDNRHQKLRTSSEAYRRWKARYLEFVARYPEEKPVYYPHRHRWW